jgi:hypothetical protein
MFFPIETRSLKRFIAPITKDLISNKSVKIQSLYETNYSKLETLYINNHQRCFLLRENQLTY